MSDTPELPPLPKVRWKWTEQPRNLERILSGKIAYPNDGFYGADQMRSYAEQAVAAERERWNFRMLDQADPFCPKCGHNRDKSSVSSIDHGEGIKSCQMCGAKWRELDCAHRCGVGAEIAAAIRKGE